MRSSHKYQALGVSAARRLLPPTGYISARDTVSIATQGFLFFWWTVPKNRKSTSAVAVSAARPPSPLSLPESTRDNTSILAGLGLNIPGDRTRASQVYKREKCSGVYYWFKGGFGLVTLLLSYEGLYMGIARPHQPALYVLPATCVAEHLSRTTFCIPPL